MSEEQLAKEAEKKRIQREKKKQRDKAKKVAQHQERIEQVLICLFSNNTFLFFSFFKKYHLLFTYQEFQSK